VFPVPSPGSEADLAVVWEGQLLARRSLRTEDGRPLRVIYRGLPGAGGAGPDFRDAVVATPEGPRRGDVELHVRASDFRRHGHGEDPAYDGVVLHVVFDAEGEVVTGLPGGGSAPVLVVPRPSRRSGGRTTARSWAEPCATAIERLGAEASAATLDRLGEMRFRQKASGARERLAAGEALEELVWEGLLEGLAYGGDREAFRRLADVAPWATLAVVLRPLAPEARGGAAKDLLERAFASLAVSPLRAVRPGNGPERRLAGAAALGARFAVNGPAEALLALLGLPPRRAAGALVRALSVPRLIGRGRAVELAANAVLPLAAALAGPAAEELHAAAVYGALPLPARYGAVRHLHRALAPVRPSARRQQGMLYLLKQYCTQGGCGRCPLS
jgi:hypothetical protein